MQNFTSKDTNNLPLITSYGNNFININNSNKINNNILLFSNGNYMQINNSIKNANYLKVESIRELFKYYSLNKDVFLVGCGNKYLIPSYEIRNFVKNSGFSLEWMITKSAIHIWNLLLEDYRDIIFLLLWE